MKNLLLILAVFITSQLRAADYYWVGGAGSWSELSHWRLNSPGGLIPSIVPAAGDNVFFDASSGFTAGNNTVTVDANAICNNMTWGAVTNNPRLVTNDAILTVTVFGNLVLSPVTTYNVLFSFQGNTPGTLTANGTVLGEFGIDVNKPGSSVTLTDNLIVPATTNIKGTNLVYLTTGTFNIANKQVIINQFSSENSNVRTLEMTNANFTVNFSYHYTGTNKTLNAAGSTLNAFGFWVDGGTYNKAIITSGNGPNTIRVYSSTFSSLTYSWAEATSAASISNGNTVDTLVFMGQGALGHNNTVGSIQFSMNAVIAGTGNNIRKIIALNNFEIWPNFTNTVDSLILAANRTTQFRGTFNINDYLYVAGTPCEAFTEINGDPATGTVNFAAGATVDISNVVLTGVNATGPDAPYVVDGADGGGNSGFTINEPSNPGIDLYWVGGAGNWNDRSHWSTTSGGAGGACVPYLNDNVVFDASSGLTGGGTVATSSISFCKNMTWVSGVGNVTFSQAATLRVYGSVVFGTTVTTNGIIDFLGADNATITTNGVPTSTGLQLNIAKTGSGVVTLTDDWNAPLGSFTFTQGGLNLAGRTISMFRLLSSNAQPRNLDITNATITVASNWNYYGANKTCTATGSHIISNGGFMVSTPGVNYPLVDLNYTGTDGNFFDISGTTFGQLTFTSASATSAARIQANNTIRRLEFKGAGIIGTGGNSIDSLIMAGSRNYVFNGASTIQKYIKAESTPCSGLIEMRGGPGTLTFASGAELHLANIYMRNMTAAGPLVPIAFNGADAGGNTGWTITSAAAGDRYWVGGGGDWNDPNHWSATSNGAPGACVPSVYDNVFFDASSGFTTGNRTVTVSSGNAYCKNLDWTGAPNAPIWNVSATWNMEIWGDSIILNPTATLNALVVAKGATPVFLKGNVLGNFDFNIDKPGSSLTVLNDYNNPLTNIGLYNGALNASGIKLNILQVDNSAAINNVFAIDISNSTVTAPFGWRFQGNIANHTLNAANSSLTTGDFKANGMPYDTVNISGNVTSDVNMNSTTINTLTFTDPSTVSAVGIVGTGNTLGRVEYKGSGVIAGTGNTMDTLIFFPGNRYTLNAGSSNTINDAWYGSGTPCRATEIVSSGGTNATITKVNGDVSFDYVRLQRITAAGTASPFSAGSHSTDQGGNVNWNIAPYDGAAPIAGLGPDFDVFLADFPVVLRTNGFFGSPSSQYTWNDASTADTLEVAGPGTYSVDVDFVDGCNISDEVVITERIILPITIKSFTVNLVDCQPHLKWKIADAVQFSHFVVEKSIDGTHYTDIAIIPLAEGVQDYSYIDETAGHFYRLRLVDIDEKYSYSRIVPVNSNCGDRSIKVYPAVTSNHVNVFLPQGYENARLNMVNAMGQQIVPVVHGSVSVKTVSLQGLPAGVYVLQVIKGNEIRNFRIIKQ